MVKFWDLDTQHCFESLTDHHSEVWGCELLLSDTRLITMSSDSELRIYDISPNATSSSSSPLSVSLLGSLKRQMSGRPHAIKVDGRGTLLVVMVRGRKSCDRVSCDYFVGRAEIISLKYLLFAVKRR